jgi:hypothetical protein
MPGEGRRVLRSLSRPFGDSLMRVNADIPDIDVVFAGGELDRSSPTGAKGLGEVGIVGMSAAIASARRALLNLPRGEQETQAQRAPLQKRTRITGCNSMPFGACPVTSWISSKKPSPRSVICWCTCFQLVVAWSRAMNALRAAAI